jgi:glycosyltransferase involved in cell wall biosynthesis
MRVLLVHNTGASSLPSGEESVVRQEAKSLESAGVDCRLHMISSEQLYGKGLWGRIKIGLNIFWSFPAMALIDQLLDQEQPDIVHFHGVLPLLTPAVFFACKRRGIPVVQTLHNFRWLCVEGGLFRANHYCDRCLGGIGWQGVIHGCARGSRLLSLVLFLVNVIYIVTGLLQKWVDHFIAVSDFVRITYMYAGFSEEKITIKANTLEALPPLSDHERSGVAYAGRLSAGKGTSILRHLIHTLDIPIHIIGDGPDFQDLKKFCCLEKHTHVVFTGYLSRVEVLDIFARSQCVVVPSLCGETFGLTALEAFSCGTPVVASRLGGLTELLTASQGGFLADPNQPDTFSQAIRQLLSDHQEARRLGKAGRAFVELSPYGRSAAKQLCTIYEKLPSFQIKAKVT